MKQIPKEIAIKYVELVCMLFLTIISICITSNINVHIIAIVAACALPIIQVKCDFLHPYCWYSGFFCLYSTSNAFLYKMGEAHYGYNKIIMIYQIIALYVALLIISPKIKKVSKEELSEQFIEKAGILNYIVFLIGSVALVFATVYLSSRGFTSKVQIYSNTGIIIKIIFRIPLILSILFPLIFIENYKKYDKIPLKEVIICGLAISILSLYSSERDLLFRFVFIVILLLYIIGYIKKQHILIIAPVGMAAILYSAVYKFYFIRGEVTSKLDKGIFYAFLTSDFQSASQNLQYLVQHEELTKKFGFERILFDFWGLFSNKYESLTSWYSSLFPAHVSGKGFTLVGEGYLIGGIGGIAILFLLIGSIIKFFYNNHVKNIYWLSAYLYFIPSIIYSIRGDLHTVFSSIFSQIFLVEICVIFLSTLSNSSRENH